MNSETIVVNLFGAPGSGKSTTATGVFSHLKRLGVRAEYVSEFAKYKTWEGSHSVLSDQVYVFGKQFHSQFILRDKVDIIITDSPLLLSEIYFDINPDERFSENWRRLMSLCFLKSFNEFNNVNMYIHRKKEYDPVGRNQSEQESDHIDAIIRDKLYRYDIPYFNTDSVEAIEDTLNVLQMKNII